MDFIDVKESDKTTVSDSANAATVNTTVSDNTIVDETLESATSTASADSDAAAQVNILDIPIENENMALNVLVSFINLGQRRGVFNVQESAKIWECIEVFKKSSAASM
mgnify:FL=1|tara:strand:+ start:1233 stop:1556 length:324 start_codon:yes stop_codon:yes gene_type:complete